MRRWEKCYTKIKLSSSFIFWAWTQLDTLSSHKTSQNQFPSNRLIFTWGWKRVVEWAVLFSQNLHGQYGPDWWENIEIRQRFGRILRVRWTNGVRFHCGSRDDRLGCDYGLSHHENPPVLLFQVLQSINQALKQTADSVHLQNVNLSVEFGVFGFQFQLIHSFIHVSIDWLIRFEKISVLWVCL